MRTRCIFVIALASATTAQAEENPCVRVYEGAVQRIDYSSSEKDIRNFIYRHTCNSSNKSKTNGFDATTSTLVNNIPAVSQFFGSFSGTSNKTFCEEFDSKKYERQSSQSLLIEPLESALNNFNQCLRIYGRSGVEISHTTTDSGLVSIYIAPAKNQQVEIQNVTPKGGFSCTKPARGFFAQNATKLEGGSPFWIKNEETLTCTREPTKTRQGDIVYNRPGSITVATSVGPYIVKVSDDTIYGPDTKRAGGLEIHKKDTEIASLQAQMNRAKVQSTNFYFGGSDLNHAGYAGKAAGENLGCSLWESGRSKFEAHVKKKYCEHANSTVIKNLGGGNGGTCGYWFFTITCLTYPKTDK